MFRAIYTDQNDRLDPKLSGVGLRGYRSDRAPIDPALSYDAPGLDPESLIDIAFYESDLRFRLQQFPLLLLNQLEDPSMMPAGRYQRRYTTRTR
ncbi:hypothetical protein AWENTII_003392 [Aspergillus wentii]